MQYQIEGTPLPVVICNLQANEQMITERGSMSWMSPNMKMETTSNGGIGKALVSAVRKNVPDAVITAVGANSAATSAMLKAGAHNAATGENAVVTGCRKRTSSWAPSASSSPTPSSVRSLRKWLCP